MFTNSFAKGGFTGHGMTVAVFVVGQEYNFTCQKIGKGNCHQIYVMFKLNIRPQGSSGANKKIENNLKITKENNKRYIA